MADDDKKTTPDELTEEDKTLMGEELNEHDDEDGETPVVNDDEYEEDVEAEAMISDGHASDEEILVTKDGLQKLHDELEYLEGTRRKEVADRLKEAISYGDLSENSEYEEAKNEQAFVEGRAIELKQMIKNAKIISEKAGSKSKTVKIGSTVTIQNLTDKDDPETYTIVGSTEADPIQAKISNESPIGSAVIDQSQGDEVKVKAPGGEYTYKIVKVA